VWRWGGVWVDRRVKERTLDIVGGILG